MVLGKLNFFAEKNETGKIEKDYDQMFIKDNKAIMYDEEERKDMKALLLLKYIWGTFLY